MSERTPLLEREEDALSTWDYVLILPCLLSNVFLAAFEGTVVASTQGAIGAAFHAFDQIAWVATSYMLVATSLQPLYGRASDLFGRRPVYLFALTFFGLGCLGSGLSQNLTQMLIARCVAGIGGGGLITISLICAWDLLAIRHRPLYQAVITLAWGSGDAMGAAVGGLLADSIGWRWAFLLPVPVAILSATTFSIRASSLARLRSSISDEKVRLGDIDFLGSLLLMLSVVVLLLLVNLGGNQIPVTSPLFPALLVFLFATIYLLIRHERQHKLPVLNLKLLSTAHMRGQIGLNIFGPMTMVGALYSMPLYFQAILGSSARVAGRRLIYPMLTAPIGSILTGWYLNRHPGRAWIMQGLGCGCFVAGAAVLLHMTYEDANARPEWWYILRLIWVHFGQGFALIASMLDILSVAGKDHASAVSLIFLMRSLGAVIGIAGSQAVLQNVLESQLHLRLTGPGSQEMIERIRKSVEVIPDLPKATRLQAILSYTVAFRATFAALIGVATLSLLGWTWGLSKRRKSVASAEE